MENNMDIFAQSLNSGLSFPQNISTRRKRRRFNPKYGKRSMAPRNIASRKILPMPENWQGWRNWQPKKKVV